MRNKMYHKHFTHPFFFFVTLVFVLESFTTTNSLYLRMTQPPTSPIHRTGKCTKTERQALLHFKSYVRHDPTGLLNTWTPRDEEETTDDCCYWSGVTCNNQSRVTHLDLGGGSLEGKISPSLLNLSYLNYLDLSYSSFNGTIPIFIGSMTQLRYLYLGLNEFSGIIPSELGNLTNLQELSLQNLRSCTFENLDWLSHLSRLEKLDMSGTSLGKVDNWVNVMLSLTKLSALLLDGCDLSQVMHPYSYSYVNSSFSSSIVSLSLTKNNLNSSMYHWLFPLTSNALLELDLSENKLDGIPKYLGNLCGLTSLYFEQNSMPINLPDFLSNLSGCTSVTLQQLYASFSQFTGSLSNDIQNFSSLQGLVLPANRLNGTISEKVWQLPNLQYLDVSSNFLKGAISENITNSNIFIVWLSNNPLEGVPLDAHMSNISSIEHIYLSSCKLGPRFPKWILTMKNLSMIEFANTQISDNIPKDFWNMWPSRLTYLNISFNNITGRIPDMVSNFDTHDLLIDLSSNNFHGHIPNVPSNVRTLDLSKNNLSGQIFFLCQIVGGSLSFLDLSHNAFTGPIPDCLWQFKELRILNLEYNNLSGRLPISIKYLINLEVLFLYSNNFSGKLPSSLTNFTQLTFLNLGANKFSGYVPGWIGERLSRLYALILTSNKFTGTIPSHLCQLVYLQILDLSMNKLQGTIPSCLSNLTSMVQDGLAVNQNLHHFFSSGDVYVDHSMIKWQGSVREFGNTLKLVKIINFSSNNLTGKISDKLIDLHKLFALDLSMNALVGEIPSKIGQMKELQILDLSRNNLSGGLPSSMSQMTFLNYLNVSYNNLSGRIPSSTQLQSFEPSRYTGNAGLCGLPLSKYCPGDEELEGPPDNRENMDDKGGTNDLQIWFYIGGATGFITGFWMVCIALLVNRRGRRAFFHLMNSLEDWVYVNMMVFTRRVSHP